MSSTSVLIISKGEEASCCLSGNELDYQESKEDEEEDGIHAVSMPSGMGIPSPHTPCRYLYSTLHPMPVHMALPSVM